MKAGDTGEAERAFGQALEADPAYIRPYLPLARLAYQQARWEDTLHLSDRALRLNPYLSGAMYLQALANYQLGRDELAEKSALALQSRQDAHRFPETHYLLGLIRSRRGEFVAAAHNLRQYLAARPNTELAHDVARQLAEWAALGVLPR
jgi:tetratricopeptide (TPR) repeat protein